MDPEIMLEIVAVYNETNLETGEPGWEDFADGFWITETINGNYQGATYGPFDSVEEARDAISEDEREGEVFVPERIRSKSDFPTKVLYKIVQVKDKAVVETADKAAEKAWELSKGWTGKIGGKGKRRDTGKRLRKEFASGFCADGFWVTQSVDGNYEGVTGETYEEAFDSVEAAIDAITDDDLTALEGYRICPESGGCSIAKLLASLRW